MVQAKFRDKLQGGKADVDWLKTQLTAEFRKFNDKRRDLRRPD